MAGINPEEKFINPGEQLRNLLQDLVPNDENFLERIDEFVGAEGELKALIYNSAINYLLRRLITGAVYLSRSLDRGEDNLFEKELGKRIEEIFKIRRPSKEFDRLVFLLIKSLESKEQDINTTATRRRLSQQGQKNCYICNNQLAFSSEALSHNDPLSAQVEHLWPRSLGGSSNLENLKLVCAKCNDKKANFLDSSDYHYEHLCLTTDGDGDDKSSREERKRLKTFDIAIQHKEAFKCVMCQEFVNRVGPLRLGRRNEEDSWHFLNVEAYCQRCYNRLYKE